MKELSTEEKAKRYDEVVNEIKNLRDILLKEGVINENGVICDNFNRIFPELKESEDEKIRKWIIENIQETLDVDGFFEGQKTMAKEALAYVEQLKKRYLNYE